MNKISTKNRLVLALALIIGLAAISCKTKEIDTPAPSSTPGYRTTKIDYNTLTVTTSYKTPFLLANGDSTINRNDGRIRLRMFRALTSYISSSITAGVIIDETKLNNMFTNTGSPFTGVYADLNNVSFNIKDVTAFSKANQSDVHHDLEVAFGKMAYISTKASQTASKGIAGKNGAYLVDENGVEWAQIIQKTLIGAYHLDLISNVLLNTGLNADNQNLVPGKKYTQLEHNWDEAYGFFTNNDMYYNGTTDQAAVEISTEYYLGSYAWEFNKEGFVKLHSAFLKGRAAVHNNDMNEVRAQATIIRKILETTIGGASNGYMSESYDASSTEALKVHAFGEGKGFVYSTRFCTLTGADDVYSVDLLDDLVTPNTPTFYDITTLQFTTVASKLRSKFNL